MSRFTIRVQLHNANSEDYEVLHEKMKEHNFLSTIENESGVSYQLPRAEYNYITKTDKEVVEVRDLVKIAVREMISESSNKELSEKQIDKMYKVFVTKSDGRSWHNLDPVED